MNCCDLLRKTDTLQILKDYFKIGGKVRHIRNGAGILQYWEIILNADMKELYAMLGDKDAYLQ